MERSPGPPRITSVPVPRVACWYMALRPYGSVVAHWPVLGPASRPISGDCCGSDGDCWATSAAGHAHKIEIKITREGESERIVFCMSSEQSTGESEKYNRTHGFRGQEQEFA